MKLGVLGGTFNPPHLGHLLIAQEALEELGLDRVVFIPAKSPPHKQDRELTDAALRVELVRAAVANNPQFYVSTMELERSGPSYTVDTLRELLANNTEGLELWFIVGADSFEEMGTWKEARALFELADVAVATRPPHKRPATPPPFLEKYLSVAGGFNGPGGKRIRYLRATFLEISSTLVRTRLGEGRSVQYLVPDGVRTILEKKWQTRQVK